MNDLFPPISFSMLAAAHSQKLRSVDQTCFWKCSRDRCYAFKNKFGEKIGGFCSKYC
jgi:hypothetical protein